MPRSSQSLSAAFGRRLREARTTAGLSQEALARRAGLSRTSITNLEQARQNASLDVLYRLSDALGLEPAGLLPPREARQSDEAIEFADLRGLAEWEQRFLRVAMTKAETTRS